jgi:hypothetical protein
MPIKDKSVLEKLILDETIIRFLKVQEIQIKNGVP